MLNTKNNEELFQCWIDAKKAEKNANLNRLNVAAEIYRRFESQLKEEGSTTIKSIPGFKLNVTTRYNRKWDMEALEKVFEVCPEAEHGFKPEYKEVRAVTKLFPQSIQKMLHPALTEKPAKPTFTVTKED